MTPKKRILPVFVPHLGCPHDCVFCNQRRITGAEAPTGKTVSELLENTDAGGAELAFYGGSFTAIPDVLQEELLGAALPFLRAGKLSGIRVSTRPDCVDGERLSRLGRFGVGTVELGAQSMCGEVLRLSGRGHTAEDTVRAAQAVKRHGFKLVLQMMTGLPGDSRERSLETAGRLAALGPDAVRIYPTVILRDTALYGMWLAGSYREHTVEEAVDWCAAIVPLFESAKIPVIRLGLNPTDALSAGGAAGGAYHPALGELTYSRIYFERARELLGGTKPGDAAVLTVNPSDVSVMTGQKKCNLAALKELYSLRDLKIRAGDVEKGRIGLSVLA